MKPTLCKNCRHFNGRFHKGAICRKGTSDAKVNPVTGARFVSIMWAEEARAPGGICGPDAVLFKPRIPWDLYFVIAVFGFFAVFVLFGLARIAFGY